MAKVKKIKVLSYAKVQAVVMAFAGLAAGFVYSFGGLFIDIQVSTGLMATVETPGLSHGTALAFMAIPVMPLYFAAIGFVTGVVGAFLYNIFAKWFGGIEMNIHE